MSNLASFVQISNPNVPWLEGPTSEAAPPWPSSDALIATLARMSAGDGAVTLRPATIEDAGAVAEIWHDGWRDGHLGNVPDALVAVRTEESFGVRAAQRVGDTVVAVADDELAGFVMVVDDEVEQVYVSARHRGTGVAAALLVEAERRVGSNGHDRAWLAVVPGNARARRFYERQGWSDEGLFDHHAPHEAGPISVPAHRYVKRVGR
jgi:ribosomal protein S18 acetylase RimI-like enzyme